MANDNRTPADAAAHAVKRETANAGPTDAYDVVVEWATVQGQPLFAVLSGLAEQEMVDTLRLTFDAGYFLIKGSAIPAEISLHGQRPSYILVPRERVSYVAVYPCASEGENA